MTTPSPDTELVRRSPGGRRRQAAAAATITVVGGTLVIDGTPVGAATYEVTNTDPAGAGSFAQAVTNANGLAGLDEITFADGLSGTIELAATVKIKDDLVITGPGDGSIVIDSSVAGDALYLYNGADLAVSGLTFESTYGSVITSNSAMTIGAVTIDDLVVDSAFAVAFELEQAQAVAVSNVSGSARAVMELDGAASLVTSNVDVDMLFPFPGGIRASNVTGNVSISDVDLDATIGAVSVDTIGGDVSVTDIGLDASLGGVTFEDVTGSVVVEDVHSTGDILLDLDVVAGPATVSRVRGDAPATFAGFFGIGTTVYMSPDVTITDSVLSGSAQVSGSGVDLVDSTIVGDSFGYPGLLIGNMSTVEATQLTLSGVDAVLLAAVLVEDSSLTLRHSTITDSTTAGHVFVVEDSDLVLDHTSAVVAPQPGSEFVDLVNNGIVPTVTADFSAVPSGAIADLGLAANNTEIDDAMLAPLADNGGETPTHLPMPGSPLIDAGDPNIAGAPALDQRDAARINPGIDIGSTEYAALTKSVDPQRFVDTRSGQDTIDGQFAGDGQRAAGAVYEVQVGGRGQVPADATAAIMNITSINPAGVGFVTAFSCDDAQPTASSLNFTPGSNLGNEVIAGLAADGKVCLFTSAATHLSVDVVGYTTPASMLKSVTPARALETRLGQPTADGQFAGIGRLAAGTQTTVRLAGRNGVPADASAVIVNVTAINPSAAGFVTIHPCLADLPTASSLNYTPGVNRGNEIVAELNAFGELCVYTSNETDLAIDVVGYLPPGSYESVEPARILESRSGQTTVDGESQAIGRLDDGDEVTLQVSGRAGVPADAQAAIVNVTAINPGGRGFVTVHPCVDPRPTASSLNYEAAVSGGNEVIAGLDASGRLCLFVSTATDLAVDIVGFIR